jgi:hypothetical protein
MKNTLIVQADPLNSFYASEINYVQLNGSSKYEFWMTLCTAYHTERKRE